MGWIDWLTIGGLGFAALGVTLIIWSALQAGARAESDAEAGDEFSASVQRFGYVQDARNRGDF